jgi:hypothetical protein
MDMEIEDIWGAFTRKMTEILHLQSAMKRMTEQSLKELAGQLDIVERLGTKDEPKLFSYMFFDSPITGHMLRCGSKNQTVEQEIDALFFHKNRQYQWLLAEAYEVYEDFLEEVYAWAGKHDRNLWPMADYGNCRASDLEKLDYEFYLAQSRKKKSKPGSILSQFRSAYREMEKLERSNGTTADLRLVGVFVEKLRHAIVHLGGVIEAKDRFIAKVLDEASINKDREQAAASLERYLREHDGKTIVSLLEVRIVEHPMAPLNPYYDICAGLIKKLISHAYLVVHFSVSAGSTEEPLISFND